MGDRVTLYKVSIIIPTYNRYRSLVRLLKSLLRSRIPPNEIIVVDDGSSDERIGNIPEKFPVVKLIRNDPPHGPQHARNRGIREAESPLIAFLDDDSIVDRDWLKHIVPHFKDRSVGIVGSRVISPIGKTSALKSIFSLKTAWFEGDNIKWYLYSKDSPIEVPFVSEHGMVFRKKIVEKLSYLDPGLIGDAWGESISFCMRARELGYKIIFEPKAITYHIHCPRGGTHRFGKYSPLGLYHKNSNRIYIFLKYHKKKWQFPFFATYLILNGLINSFIFKDPYTLIYAIRGMLKGIKQYIKHKKNSHK